MGKFFNTIMCMVLFITSWTLLFAEEAVPGIDQIGDALIALVKEWKVLGTLGIMIATLNILVMVLKSGFCKGWFGARSPLVKRFLIVLFGQALGVLMMVASGVSWLAAIVSGLVTSGGAVLVYESLKPLFKKKEK